MEARSGVIGAVVGGTNSAAATCHGGTRSGGIGEAVVWQGQRLGVGRRRGASKAHKSNQSACVATIGLHRRCLVISIAEVVTVQYNDLREGC